MEEKVPDVNQQQSTAGQRVPLIYTASALGPYRDRRMREKRRGEGSPSWHLVWREAKPAPALLLHRCTEVENLHQQPQLLLAAEGQTRGSLPVPAARWWVHRVPGINCGSNFLLS